MSSGTNGPDLFDGGGKDEIAHGRGGDDTLLGHGGDDQLFGEGGWDILDGGIGNDTLDGGVGNDLLLGFDGADVLLGGGGKDDLNGERGSDTLTGGDGRDWFFFTRASDSDSLNTDTITDLSGADDRIILKRIDADTTTDGNQAFHLVDAFTNHAGELTLTYDAGNNRTELAGDTDGDGDADLLVYLSGNHEDFTSFAL
ncbi:MAG: calcium-binding protein [Caulobacteraceae bacterium]